MFHYEVYLITAASGAVATKAGPGPSLWIYLAKMFETKNQVGLRRPLKTKQWKQSDKYWM